MNHEPARVDDAMTVCEHMRNGSDIDHARNGAARGRARRLEPESVKINRRLFLHVAAQELIHDSRLAMDQTADDALAVGRRVSTALLLLGVLGPLSGLGIGYGVARGLSHSLARLSVRLRDVHAHLEQEVGSVDVEADGD